MNPQSLSRTEGKLSRASVIIPAFNDKSGIDLCMEFLRRQTWPCDTMEVVVVDNGSVPPLLLAGEFPFPVRLVRCMTPGSYAARNAGVKAALGDVLAFTDADCWPGEKWLAQGVACLTAGGGKSVVGGEVTVVKPTKPTAVALYQLATGFAQEGNVRAKGFSATANLFCTRGQFEEVGPFDERLMSGGDREWCWRAAKCGITVQYEPTAVVHTHPRSDLHGAIRQARRVVAGRKMLRDLGLAHIGDDAVAKLRSPWQAAIWILSNKELRVSDRVRVLFVAIVIRSVVAIESWRLRLGGTAERR